MIDRVSTLFHGHPKLIQGFNTFLPPGYRIECQNTGTENLITVTTPTGTVSHQPGGFAAAYSSRFKKTTSPPVAAPAAPAISASAVPGSSASMNQSSTPSNPRSNTATAIEPKASTSSAAPAQGTAGTSSASTAAPAAVSLPANPPQPPKAPSGPSTPSAANTLASVFGHNQAGTQAPIATSAQAGGRTGHALVEFNHAITFVNKIKNRFNNDAETYKQFLEILQTYQRDGKGINEVSSSGLAAIGGRRGALVSYGRAYANTTAQVYAQVSKLFNDAPDLIKEFKQFLPESSGGPPQFSDSFGQVLSAASEPTITAGQKRPSKDVAPPPAGKKRRVPEPKTAPAKVSGIHLGGDGNESADESRKA